MLKRLADPFARRPGDWRRRRRSRWAYSFLTTTLALLFLDSSARAADEYHLDVGDVLEISVATFPDMRQRLPIQIDGSIYYPQVGRLTVAGLTVADAQQLLQTALSSQIFRHRLPDGRELSVTTEPRDIAAQVVEYRPIYVDGDVSRPGEQPYRALMTVRQAISVAGGYDLLRFGTKTPMVDLADARGEHQATTADLVKELANIARIRRELGEKDPSSGVTALGSALPRQVVQDLQKSQLDLFAIDMSDFERERSFLKRSVEQLTQQSDVLVRQQRDEEHGLKLDTQELDRLSDLLSKGSVISQRVTEARRAALLSSTRALQTTAQLMQASRQKDEIARQLERLDDLRRAKLLSELSDRIAKAQQLQARMNALDMKMAGLVARPNEAISAKRVPVLHIIRRSGDHHDRIAVEEDAGLKPGDVIEVAMKASSDLASALP